MSRGGRWIAIGVGIAVVPLVIWALLQAPEDAPGRSGAAPEGAVTPTPRALASPKPSGLPAIKAEGTGISTVDAAGRRQWDIRAEAVTVDAASSTATLTGVEGTYFQAGEPAIAFSAPRGTFNVTARTVVLSGRVRARATSGHTLEADVVRWFPKAQQIEASGSVALRQGGMVVLGDHLIADVALQRTRMTGNVRVSVER